MEKETHFSVSFSCTIGGSRFRPGVCYATTKSLHATIAKLVSEGRATFYNCEMQFVTGVPTPVTTTRAPFVLPKTAHAVTRTVEAPKKSVKKGKRGKEFV
jgi:hypothetical protein